MCSNQIKYHFLYDLTKTDQAAYHNNDEMDAALALLMLHYQTQTFENTANSQQPLNLFKFNNSNKSESAPPSRPPGGKKGNKRAPLIKPTYSQHQEKPAKDLNPPRTKKNATLLTSCRNILKDFLGQNGFQ